MNDQYQVYMVECSDKSIYTGIAKDVDKRLNQHSKGIGSKYVRARLPITLQWSSDKMDLSSALKMEHRIKSWSKEKKEQWINVDHLDGYERGLLSNMG